MDRKISLADVKTAVQQAYDHLKDLHEGAPKAEVADMNVGKFGISVRLADGRKFDVGHTQAQFAMGAISRVPVGLQLLTQMSVDELVQKMAMGGKGKCCCQAAEPADANPKHGLHAKALRAVSMVQPVGDFDGKMNLLSDLMISLMGSSPVLDDKLYEAAVAKDVADDKVNRLAALGYELYDDASIAVKLYSRLRSMLVTTEQLAEMGATIAADGVNPVTKEVVFDGALSATLCSMIAAKGPKHMGKPWLMMTGVPAISGFGGGFFTVIPGVGSICAFSPNLNEAGIPMQAALAIKEIVQKLQLNAFSSARVEIVD